MARLYADENFPLPVVESLRRLGHDVVTLQQTGQGGRALSDEEVLGAAAREGRAVLTLNRRHFMRLHREHAEHAGVIVCTFDMDSPDRRVESMLRCGRPRRSWGSSCG
jgi:hypothetical protein